MQDIRTKSCIVLVRFLSVYFQFWHREFFTAAEANDIFYNWTLVLVTDNSEVSTMNSRESSECLVLRCAQLCTHLGLSRSTIYDRIDSKSMRYDASFPKPISLGGTAVGWLVEDVSSWLAKAKAVSNT